MEHGLFIDDVPIPKSDDFHSYVNVYVEGKHQQKPARTWGMALDIEIRIPRTSLAQLAFLSTVNRWKDVKDASLKPL